MTDRQAGGRGGAPAAPADLVARYALALGDDALILAQRLGEWVTRAPELEEEVALANIALDLLGQARTLLGYAGSFDGRSEDDLAFLRTEREFTHLQITERPNGDFAATIARQLFFAAYQHALYSRLCSSTDATLAGVAGKAVKEVAYHRDHAVQWTLRLGDGTPVSHERMQAGLDVMWPWVAEMFAPDDVATALVGAGVAVDPAGLRAEWDAVVLPVLAEATLTVPEARAARGGGRAGVHGEPFSALLAEMAHLHLSYPGAQW